MKTVGTILRETRAEKNISLEQVAKETKIRFKYLEALEKDSYELLPSGTSARGFIKNYADFLGLSPRPILAIFKRDFAKSQKESLLPQGMVRSLDKSRFAWTPRTTIIVAVVIAGLLFLTYLAWQYSFLARTPYQ